MSRCLIRIAPTLSRTLALALAAAAASASLGLAPAFAADGSQPAASPAAAMPATAASGLRFQVIEGSGGVPLNVVTAGDKSKPPILLVHGIGQSYVSWENQLKPPVTDQFYVVAFDLRGHGNSGKPWGKENYADYRKYAEDVQAVIKGTGIDRKRVLSDGAERSIQLRNGIVEVVAQAIDAGHKRRIDTIIEIAVGWPWCRIRKRKCCGFAWKK